ncbi:prolyl oligopeptidase family serine peptidase [Candidatus Daviesbacteria bacterium]|nr:prolyl oligopeptidase family serine peptidase [Candidatus Daviesbacteria bacterium]
MLQLNFIPLKKITVVIVILAGVFLSNLSSQKDNTRPEDNNLGGPQEELHLLSIEYMRKQSYPGSEITIEQTLPPGSNYSQYIASYKSDGLKIYALLTVPQDDNRKYPVIVFNHGYIQPAQYRTTERYTDYVDVFARNGYIVFKPDYRGHGNSEGKAEGGYGSNAYTIDILNALSSMKKYKDADPEKIGMWGHSMGGSITLRSMVISKDIKVGVIWAGVVGSYADILNNWRRRAPAHINHPGSSWRQELIEKYGTPEENQKFWDSISANSYLNDISGPMQLHHGTADESVPLQFSEKLSSDLKGLSKTVELFTYEGDNHNISNNFNIAIQKSVEFFNKYLKYRSFSNFNNDSENSAVNIALPTSTTFPTVNLIQPTQSKILPTDYHVFQKFNNCGPAALSMTLRFYGINVSQAELGQALRPYQVPNGDNDDKSVTLEEMADKAREYSLVPYHRPNGDIEKIKLFITYDIPVIARTWTKVNEDIGHYRVVKGYDDTNSQIIQDDSLQNKNLWFDYDTFNTIWEKFNFEYLVLVSQEKKKIAEAILGEDFNIKKAWQKAAQNAQRQLVVNPDDIYSRFNLSVAFYNTGQYQQSVEEFEKVEDALPFRTLWYQIEPIQAYYQLENYERVLQTTNKVLSSYNRAFSELYILRGKIYQKQGNIEAARNEFEKAVYYNKSLKDAQQALNSIT